MIKASSSNQIASDRSQSTRPLSTSNQNSQRSKFLTKGGTEEAAAETQTRNSKMPTANIPQPSFKSSTSGGLASYNFHPQQQDQSAYPANVTETRQDSHSRDVSPLNASRENQKPPTFPKSSDSKAN
jgi:hypothetical protein